VAILLVFTLDLSSLVKTVASPFFSRLAENATPLLSGFHLPFFIHLKQNVWAIGLATASRIAEVSHGSGDIVTQASGELCGSSGD
jgi:hypothetical protein